MGAPQLEDPIGELAAETIGAVVRAPRVVSEPLDSLLSTVSAPTTKGASRDPEDPEDVRGAYPLLNLLFDEL
jgi:hypothetical protein